MKLNDSIYTNIHLGLQIIGDEDNPIFEISEEEAIHNGEAKVQLLEGCSYEYQFIDNKYKFDEKSNNNKIISFSKFSKFKGAINPNIYVGTHSLDIKGIEQAFSIEVRSIKSEYRSDYRYMLEDITEKCTDLIMQIDSPVSQNFETNFDTDSQTLYQRFCFVKSLIGSKEFEEAIQKIVSNPTTKWEDEQEENDIRNIKRFNQKFINQLISKGNRIPIESDHYLNQNYSLNSIPTRINSIRKIESIDTAENRFIKHALEEFLFFSENCTDKFEKYSSAKRDALNLTDSISNLLNQSFFKEITRPNSLKLNSPVLQRKGGYREVLNAWLKFDLAAKLIWHGGDNVYDAGKKDIATLYEYWLFFTLLDILKDVFEIQPKSIEQLIQFDKNSLSLNLKQGTSIALKGVFNAPFRSLNIQFSYNRSFGGGKAFPKEGSYTTTLRPDYTLSIWPADIKEANDAEIKELITHIHFDAKYKVNNFYDLVQETESEEDLNNYKEEERKGTFKNADLLKMHAYKDAIRRTGGAYVLYPGVGDKTYRGFHELIPGLGAFVIKPNRENKDKVHLKNFIKKVVDNFIDRASQREHVAVKTYEIHKVVKQDQDILHEPLPEYNNFKKIVPSETFVLVGYYKDKDHLKWILNSKKYNFRAGSNNGSLPIGIEVVNAEYLVLHGPNEVQTKKIYKLNGKGPKIYSKQNLINQKYPTIPNGDLYLIYEIEKEVSEDFGFSVFDLKKLNNYSSFRNSAKPISVSLIDLMKSKNR